MHSIIKSNLSACIIVWSKHTVNDAQQCSLYSTTFSVLSVHLKTSIKIGIYRPESSGRGTLHNCHPFSLGGRVAQCGPDPY